MVFRSEGGTDEQQVAICTTHHGHIHPGPEPAVRMQRVVLEQGGWVFDSSRQRVKLTERMSECLKLAVPDRRWGGGRESPFYGLYQFGSVLEKNCPYCGKTVPKNPGNNWFATDATGVFMQCPARNCGFTYHGWVWLIWGNVESWWEHRATSGDSAVDGLLLERERIGWELAGTLADMANGRLWVMHGYDSMRQYALSKRKSYDTWKHYLTAERRTRALPEDVAKQVRENLPLHVVYTKGAKLAAMDPDEILALVHSRKEGATTAMLEGEIDEQALLARDRDKPVISARKVEREVELIAKATTYSVRVRVFPDASHEQAVKEAQDRVLRSPLVVGVEWGKGHQVREV